MLKPLLLAATTLFPLTAMSIDLIQTANAAPITHQQLIAKGDKASHINSQQQSDIKNIRQTLTTFYRGFNQYNVETMALAATSPTSKDKASIQGMFDRLKAARVDMSIEIQSIELVALTDRTAVVRMDQKIRVTSPQRSGTSQSSSTVSLIKDRGQWKISDGTTAMGRIQQDR